MCCCPTAASFVILTPSLGYNQRKPQRIRIAGAPCRTSSTSRPNVIPRSFSSFPPSKAPRIQFYFFQKQCAPPGGINGDRGGGGGHGRNSDDGNPGDSNNQPIATLAFAPHRRKTASAGQDVPSTVLPPWLRDLSLTNMLLLLTVCIYGVQFLSNDLLTTMFMKENALIRSGQLYRLLTPVFLHASITHLLINCLSLRSTGPVIESWYGKGRFASLYLFGGICGNILSFYRSPAAGVGASGAIFGLIGALGVLLIRHRNILGKKSSQYALNSLAFTIALNFGIGLMPGSFIDNYAHLGGLLGGALFGYIAGPRLRRMRSVAGKYYLVDQPVINQWSRQTRIKWRALVNEIKS